jgi:tripartite-type tricarboxylate transporter receptor subunit TctC
MLRFFTQAVRLSTFTKTIITVWCSLAFLMPAPAGAQEVYAGKTVRFVVGVSAGGGFDLLTRMIARHMGRHLPGNPAMIVENMPGAGSLIAANYVYNRAKPDGLTIGMWNGGLVLRQILGTEKGIEFDAVKFGWLGVPVTSNPVCAMSENSGIDSLEKWMAAKHPVKIGGIAPGIPTDDIPKILRAALALPVQVVHGYKGTADIRLAADSGEVSGACWGWESMKVTWPAIESKKARVVLQAVPKKIAELPNVPNAIDYVKSADGRQLIESGIHDPLTIIYLYSVPPRTPQDSLLQLRRAFTATMKDSKFLADARQAAQDIDPIPGEEVEKIITKLSKLDPAVVKRLKEVVSANN